MRGTGNKLWVWMATGRRKGCEEEKEEEKKKKSKNKEKQHSRVTCSCVRSG